MSDEPTITFLGHFCVDDIYDYGDETARTVPGSAVRAGALVSSRLGFTTRAIVRLDPADQALLAPLRDRGVACTMVPADQTTRMILRHPSPDLDVRTMHQSASAGFFRMSDLPFDGGPIFHLAGITDREFSVDFVAAVSRLRGDGWTQCLSVDLQSFVRQVGTDGTITLGDVPGKEALCARMDVIKLDIIEAQTLTGSHDPAEALGIMRSWTQAEIVLTRHDGVYLADDRSVGAFVPFTNRTLAGRTGRGDTVIAAYLCRRQTHCARDSLRFAAAAASIKMETNGGFDVGVAEVEHRMK